MKLFVTVFAAVFALGAVGAGIVGCDTYRVASGTGGGALPQDNEDNQGNEDNQDDQDNQDYGIVFASTVKNTSAFAGVSSSGAEMVFQAVTGGEAGDDVYDPNVYFVAHRPEGVTVSVGGEDAAYIAKAAGTADGSGPGKTSDVFAVRPKPVVGANGEMLDTQFDGGVYRFTVTAGGKTRAVTLQVAAHLTGVAVFKVNAKTEAAVAELAEGQNVLERLTGILECDVLAGPSFGISYSFITFGGDDGTDGPSEGNFLLSALAHVDRNGEFGNEYLIRMEGDEALPRISLGCNKPPSGAERVTVRLRGAGNEQRITYDKDVPVGYYNDVLWADWRGISDYGFGFINIGSDALNKPAYVTLALEKNVTVTGPGVKIEHTYPNYASQPEHYFIHLMQSTRLIMRDGSKITGYYYPFDTGTWRGHLIYADSTSKGMSYFEMQGGEITGNTANYMVRGSATIAFKKSGGRVYNNINNVFGRSTTSHLELTIPETEGAWNYD
jgi:hypothetical protein